MNPDALTVSASPEATLDYWKLYERLIKSRLGVARDGYTEEHHIIPRSLGGSDDPVNLIRLTYREHFLAHWLLVKMFPRGVEHRKMQKAFHSMLMDGAGRMLMGWQVETIKRANKDRRLNRQKKLYYARCERVILRNMRRGLPPNVGLPSKPPGLKGLRHVKAAAKRSHEERLASWKAKRDAHRSHL